MRGRLVGLAIAAVCCEVLLAIATLDEWEAFVLGAVFGAFFWWAGLAYDEIARHNRKRG